MHVETRPTVQICNLNHDSRRESQHAETAPTHNNNAAARSFDVTSERDWAELVRNVTTIANSGGRITIAVTVEPNETFRQPQPVRIVTDPDAPALQPQDVDRLYPWRQKDLVREINHRIGRRMLNSYDIQAVRRHHNLDERPDFVFNLPGAGRRYSPAVADWIIDQLARDSEFFHTARIADQEMLKLRRQKPK
jgi:hypothetical protein